MVGVRVVDVAALGEGRDDDKRNARPVAEKVERLDVAGVVVAAAFVQRDDERGFRHQFGLPLQVIHDVRDHALEEVKLGGCRVAVQQAIRFDEETDGKS